MVQSCNPLLNHPIGAEMNVVTPEAIVITACLVAGLLFIALALVIAGRQ